MRIEAEEVVELDGWYAVAFQWWGVEYSSFERG